MYTDKNIIYAEPGKYLKYKNQVAFQFPAKGGVIEYILNIDDLVIKNNIAIYNNGLCAQTIHKN